MVVVVLEQFDECRLPAILSTLASLRVAEVVVVVIDCCFGIRRMNMNIAGFHTNKFTSQADHLRY
jgi:hypothetical protein